MLQTIMVGLTGQPEPSVPGASYRAGPKPGSAGHTTRAQPALSIRAVPPIVASRTGAIPFHIWVASRRRLVAAKKRRIPAGAVIELNRLAGSARISLAGEIDIVNAATITDQVAAALGNRPSIVTLDMAAVDFIDSVGLGALVVAKKLCAAAGAELAIASPSKQVSRLLALTGLSGVFGLAATP
ncbi:MAG: hypothetical protein JWN61_2294 [Pseudonocardiales bacterium]|nr:hypothetical protein [Pseudonocardiales bacterium]